MKNPILKTYKETGRLAHAHLLYGNIELSRKMAMELAGELLSGHDKLESHPDFFYRQSEMFSIGESRELKEKTFTKPLLGNKKVFILEVGGFATEAANALLKTMEEPPEGTHFFVITQTAESIMPTLRSRFAMTEILEENRPEIRNKDLINDFIESSPKRRMDLVKTFFEKDKVEVVEFLNELEIVLESRKNLKALEEIERVKKFLFNPTGSQKMILEHLALTL
jgi:DNA polymerase III delta prime subunit